MRRALVGGLLVGAGVFAFRRLRRRHRAGRRRAPTLVLLLTLALPLHWWDDVWSGVTSVPGVIKDWVLGLVGDIADWIDSSLSWLGGRLDDLLGWIGDAFQAAYNFASSLVNDLIGWIQQALGDLYRWAEEGLAAVSSFLGQLYDWAAAALDQLGQWVTAAIDQLGKWAADALGQLWDWVQGLAQWVLDNVFTPLENFILWLWHNVVEAAVKWIMGFVGQLWEFAFGWATALLEVVEKAFDWLVMLAEHGPAWVVEQVADAIHRAPGWFADGIVSAMDGEGDKVERYVADWLG